MSATWSNCPTCRGGLAVNNVHRCHTRTRLTERGRDWLATAQLFAALLLALALAAAVDGWLG